MEEALNDNSFERRLDMQNEVLRWLEDFSEKLQKRANDVTVEMHGLLDQTGVVEQDLRNTFNSFRSLSNIQFIENRIHEEDETTIGVREGMEKSAKADIPAQSYETDILPRYKEALSLGLSSCRHHFQKTNRNSSTGSVFKMGSTHGQLPHIIGSEEYMHDNSCGLTEDLISEWDPLNFSHEVKSTGVQSDAALAGSPAMFDANLFGIEHNPSEKDGIEPLVSAALDFKAMLEAALLSPYKFYDDESSSLATIGRDYNDNFKEFHANLDHRTPETSNTIEVPSSNNLTDTEKRNISIPAGDLTSHQYSDISIHKLPSALISGSLFDTEEQTFPSSRNQPVDYLQLENTDGSNLAGISDNPGLSVPDGPGVYSVKSSMVHAVADALTGVIEKESSCEGTINVSDDFVQDFGSPVSRSSPCSPKTKTTFSPFDDSDNKGAGKVLEGFLTGPWKGLFDESDVDDASGISESISGAGHQEQITIRTSDIEDTATTNETSSSNIAHQMLLKQSDSNEMNKVASGLISKAEPLSSTNISYSGNASIITYVQQREKPVFPIVPKREEPVFSTVVSISPAALGSTIDLDTWSSSSNEDISGSSFLQEKTIPIEIFNTELQPELCEAVPPEHSSNCVKSETFSAMLADAERNPEFQKCSVVNRLVTHLLVEFTKYLGTCSSSHESINRPFMGGNAQEPRFRVLIFRDSFRYKFRKMIKQIKAWNINLKGIEEHALNQSSCYDFCFIWSICCRTGSLPADLLAAEEVQYNTASQVEEREGQGDLISEAYGVVSSSKPTSSIEVNNVDSTNSLLLPLGGEGRSSVIASLLKLPVSRPSLFDSDDEDN